MRMNGNKMRLLKRKETVYMDFSKESKNIFYHVDSARKSGRTTSAFG